MTALDRKPVASMTPVVELSAGGLLSPGFERLCRALMLFEGDGGIPCCPGSAEHGPASCTCWEPIYSDPQNLPQAGPAAVMPAPCGDCAYRADSPERNGGAPVRHDAEQLEELVADGEPFYCHTGMRQVVAWEHPVGVRVEVRPADVDYRPPIVRGRPYQASGAPGLLCAGWAARRRSLVRSGVRP